MMLILKKRVIILVLLLYTPASCVCEELTHEPEKETDPHNEWHPETSEKLEENVGEYSIGGVQGDDHCPVDGCPSHVEEVDQGELQLLEEDDVTTSAPTCDGDCTENLPEESGVIEAPVEDIAVTEEVDGAAEVTDSHQTNSVMDENEPKDSTFDMELENIPLREILLKLKPEGLTDEDEDQTTDYSTTENSLEEAEVEEEALVSSGSPGKQKDSVDSSSSSSGGESGSGTMSGGAGSKKAVCAPSNVTDAVQDVEIINATHLMKLLQGDPNITSRSLAGPCFLIYFFSPYCPFSVMGSPFINALARSLPNVPVFGLDSIEHHSVNARYGVMGTPTLLLFHNGNGVGRYNASEYSVNHLLSFVHHYTDQDIDTINVTSADFHANLPSKLAERLPYSLWAAWIFLLSCASWLFLDSELCARLTEAILNNWREAEAQHHHED